MVKTAPWQALSDALLIAAAPVSVNEAAPPAGTLNVRPVWLTNVTPVDALHAGTVEVTAPLPVTVATVTGYGLGLLILMKTSPVPLGNRVAVVVADTSTVVRACAVPALAYPWPPPDAVHAAYATLDTKMMPNRI